MLLYCWQHRSPPLWCAALHAFDRPLADGNHEAHGVVEQRPLGQTTPPHHHPAHLHPVSVPSTHLYSVNGSAFRSNASTDTHKSRPQPAPSRVIRRPRPCQAPTSSWPRNPTPTTSPHLLPTSLADFATPQPAPSHVIQRLQPRHTSIQPLATSSNTYDPSSSLSPLRSAPTTSPLPQPAPGHVIRCLQPRHGYIHPLATSSNAYDPTSSPSPPHSAPTRTPQ